MKVLKFGGSSVSTPQRIRNTKEIIESILSFDPSHQIIVVFSAFGGATDFLLKLGSFASQGDVEYLNLLSTFKERHNHAAHELLEGSKLQKVLEELEENYTELESLLKGLFLLKEMSARSQDLLVSFGERNSTRIISAYLDSYGLDAQFVDARDLIITNDSFGSAKVQYKITNERIKNFFRESPHKLSVITGFIGRTQSGATTTLGRGGSDYTAAIFAAATNAAALEIWTDVDGVLTSDPNKVPKAFTIPQLTYEEAMEMSHYGAKVIYPPTIQPVLSKGIPLYIKNTMAPDNPGTLVTNSLNGYNKSVKGVSSISQIALITIQGPGLIGVPGTAARVFSCLAHNGINVILITQGSSEHSISFAVKEDDGPKAKKSLEEEFNTELTKGFVDSIVLESSLSILAVVGEKMRFLPGLAGRLFTALGQNGINCSAIAQGSSERNISFVVNRHDEIKALNVVHDAFFLSDIREIHVFIIGVGLVGKTLLAQIRDHAAFLQREKQLRIKIIGLANSKKMIFDLSGISLENWKETLTSSDQKMVLEDFIKEMISFNLPNTIFVDNTANSSVASSYESIIDSSISIVTPNKKAFSGSLAYYKRLKDLAILRDVRLLYETNVGAGLPVLSTLDNLISSGDELIRIEGVVSGSLSFIFNSFNKEKKFSQLVKDAKQLGYTEPDPREDLSCFDVRRKMLILARDSGFDLQEEDITIEPFLPDALFGDSSIGAFLEDLEGYDSKMEELRRNAEMSNCRLAIIGEVKDGKASILLKQVEKSSPFYNLSGSDNMIVFTTSRYYKNPLVIRGPGAGSEVTAAGVFADIISIGIKH